MEKKEKKKIWQNKKAVCLLLLAVALLSFGSTWAYYYSNEIELDNPFSTTHSGASMVEEFDPGSSFLPGETVAKVVAFTNTGDMDLLLRVEVPPDEAWYSDGVEDEDLSTEYVIKNWSGYWATLADGVSAFTAASDNNYLEDDYDAGENEWTEVYSTDGRKYRYYKQILEKEDTTHPILESITLGTEVSNDRHDYDYSGKTYKLTFNAEAIPVEGGTVQSGALSEWGMTATVDDDGKVDWSQS